MTGPEHQERATYLLGLVDRIREAEYGSVKVYNPYRMLREGDVPLLIAEAQAHTALAHNALMATLSPNRFLLSDEWSKALGVTG